MPGAYYNENAAYPAQWLVNLIEADHLLAGRVDGRSILDVTPAELGDYTRCHFFAGIGGWDLALQMAGWPVDVPVWTGSCPCQPFSAAGKHKGFADDRHLWPAWFKLIAQCRPAIIFGEQVASPDGLRWFDAVCADLEGADYAVRAADLCAAGVGAPHIRQRLWFVAISGGQRRDGFSVRVQSGGSRQAGVEVAGGGEISIVANPLPAGRAKGWARAGIGSVAGGSWSNCDWVPCRDGKSRPVEPGSFPLAHGVSNRVGKLRAYGNAIVPQVASVFIQAVMEELKMVAKKRNPVKVDRVETPDGEPAIVPDEMDPVELPPVPPTPKKAKQIPLPGVPLPEPPQERPVVALPPPTPCPPGAWEIVIPIPPALQTQFGGRAQLRLFMGVDWSRNNVFGGELKAVTTVMNQDDLVFDPDAEEPPR